MSFLSLLRAKRITKPESIFRGTVKRRMESTESLRKKTLSNSQTRREGKTGLIGLGNAVEEIRVLLQVFYVEVYQFP